MGDSGVYANQTVPVGQYAPFAVITDTDHAGWLIIATALGLAMVLVFTAIRLNIRLTINPGIGWDDAFVTSSTLLTFIYTGLILSACADGLGKTIDQLSQAKAERVQKLTYASSLIFILAITCSKVAVTCFLSRLSPARRHRYAFFTMIGVEVVWGFAALLAIAVPCHVSKPWLTLNQCTTGADARWQAICGLDIAVEVILLALVFFLVYDLQFDAGQKIIIVTVFAMRTPVIIATAFRIHEFSGAAAARDPTFANTEFYIWTATELCYSVISSTIIILRPLMKELHTGWGEFTRSVMATNGGGYALSEMSPNHSQVGAGGGGSGSASGSGSGIRSKNGTKDAAEDGFEDCDDADDSSDNSTNKLAPMPLSDLDPRLARYRVGVAVPKLDVPGAAGDESSWSKRSISGRASTVVSTPTTMRRKESSESQRMIIKKDITWEIDSTKSA